MWTVYILYNIEKDKIYIGRTTDLPTRLKRHNGLLPSKFSSYTRKNHGRWIVIYQEISLQEKQSIEREKWLKSGVGREFIHSNIEEWLKKSQR